MAYNYQAGPSSWQQQGPNPYQQRPGSYTRPRPSPYEQQGSSPWGGYRGNRGNQGGQGRARRRDHSVRGGSISARRRGNRTYDRFSNPGRRGRGGPVRTNGGVGRSSWRSDLGNAAGPRWAEQGNAAGPRWAAQGNAVGPRWAEQANPWNGPQYAGHYLLGSRGAGTHPWNGPGANQGSSGPMSTPSSGFDVNDVLNMVGGDTFNVDDWLAILGGFN